MWRSRMFVSPDRRGTALLVAITLLTLGAALLVGGSAATRSAMRAQLSHEAAMRADAEARRKLAEFVARWNWAAEPKMGTA